MDRQCGRRRGGRWESHRELLIDDILFVSYPIITRAWFERFEIHMSCPIFCSILYFIHLSVIVYTSKL
jgi:hypothetical protein